MDQFMTLREAADLVGVSRPTLFRAVQRGELVVRTETIGKTKKILVSGESVKAWACSREQDEQPVEQVFEQPEQRSEQLEQVPVMAHLEIVRLLEDTQVRLLDATERAHRAERQADLMRLELLATRNCLTEQAESIFEKAARVKQHEEMLLESQAQKDAWERERAELERENQERLSLYEQEKQQWMLEVETTKSRVNWLEKRVPRWVRGLFGAV